MLDLLLLQQVNTKRADSLGVIPESDRVYDYPFGDRCLERKRQVPLASVSFLALFFLRLVAPDIEISEPRL